MLTPVQSASVLFHSSSTGLGADPISGMGVPMSFAREEEIYGQEEEADLVYQVLKGAVRTSRLLSDGRRQIGDFYYPGDVFGIEPDEEHLFSAEALCDCVVLVVKRSSLRDTARIAFDRMIHTAARRELRRAHEHVLLLGRKTAREKVATFLLNIIERVSGDGARLSMSRQDIADYLGLTIETVSRMLTQLQVSRVIEFVGLRDFHVVNRAQLAYLAQ